VVLPAAYLRQPERRFPVIYSIPGFGGSHREALRYPTPPEAAAGEVDFIRVMLDGNCSWGHHVFADSATNGPRGEALVSELIPHIDATFRTVAAPTARFVTGHSSGGWSSLWLQVNYPDTFGGVWSTSPDPVDFRDYQQVNLYADPPQSLYTDEQGNRRPIARRGNVPVLWYDSFAKMDDVLGRGGQLRSFEAVFSPLDGQNLPRKLWDRTTGRIDPEVAQAWRKYDIRLQLEDNWQTLEPKLRGKLHVTSGALDTFYLEGAVDLLAASLSRLGSDAQVHIVPGKDHGNLLTPELYRQIRREMSDAFLRHHSTD
jgi:pimeloyl-ACP methyl ester carboxylesterase